MTFGPVTRRFGVVALVFVIALGITPAAEACNEPRLGSVTPTAAAGDPVAYSVVNLEPGATVSITAGGRAVGGGTATGSALGGSFSMPDLGAATTVWVEARTTHEGASWVSTQPVRFVVPEPKPATQAEQPEPAAPPRPKPKPKPKAKATAPIEAPAARAAEAPATVPIAGRAAAASPAPTPKAEAKKQTQTTTAEAKSKAAAKAPRTFAPRLHDPFEPPAPVVAAPAHERPIPVAVPAAPARAPGDDVRAPLLLVATAVLLLAAAAAVGYRRTRAARRSAALETELQEMIVATRGARARAATKSR